MAVEIPNAERLETKILLGQVLTLLNADERAKFYVSRGKGAPTVQCLRVMLSRIRNKLRHKGKRIKHFKLHADVIPWSEEPWGPKVDCVILSRTRNQDHQVLETLEELLSNGQSRSDD